MQLVKPILKYVLYFIIVSIAIGTLIISYQNYQTALEMEEELKYKTTHNWKWHDEYRRIQISTNDEFNQSILRKVHMDKYAIYANILINHNLLAEVIFYVKCTPKFVIKTSKKFSDGSIKELVCLENGEGLRFRAVFPNSKIEDSWKEDLDGFSFREDIQYWDFTKLDQEITLFNAKIPDDTPKEATKVEPEVKPSMTEEELLKSLDEFEKIDEANQASKLKTEPKQSAVEEDEYIVDKDGKRHKVSKVKWDRGVVDQNGKGIYSKPRPSGRIYTE